MGTFYSGDAGNTVQGGITIDDTRRQFNFGERIAELAPQQSPFFVYLSKVAKKTTDDPVFKFLEQRHQWQRRTFEVAAVGSITATAVGAALTEALVLTCNYDSYGNIVSADQACPWILPGQVISIQLTGGAVMTVKLSANITYNANDTTIDATDGCTLLSTALAGSETITADAPGQVIGSAWAEGSENPNGWEDKLFDREGYCQIFKTGMNLFSNTARATRYRGVANEYQRVWQEKLMEHKMDIEHAMLYGIGGTTAAFETGTGPPVRYTHGIVPYTEANGKVYNMTYASSGYDAFLDALEDFFAPESGNSGNKLVLSSRKVITYLNKLGNCSFLNNSVGSSQYSLDVTQIPGSFGHTVTKVSTIFGNLHFVAEPLLRGPWEDFCCAVDMKNIAYRPLAGNGINRDTFVETNIQGNAVDGRQDQIITEAGLEIQLPETHAILKFG